MLYSFILNANETGFKYTMCLKKTDHLGCHSDADSQTGKLVSWWELWGRGVKHTACGPDLAHRTILFSPCCCPWVLEWPTGSKQGASDDHMHCMRPQSQIAPQSSCKQHSLRVTTCYSGAMMCIEAPLELRDLAAHSCSSSSSETMLLLQKSSQKTWKAWMTKKDRLYMKRH